MDVENENEFHWPCNSLCVSLPKSCYSNQDALRCCSERFGLDPAEIDCCDFNDRNSYLCMLNNPNTSVGHFENIIRKNKELTLQLEKATRAFKTLGEKVSSDNSLLEYYSQKCQEQELLIDKLKIQMQPKPRHVDGSKSYTDLYAHERDLSKMKSHSRRASVRINTQECLSECHTCSCQQFKSRNGTPWICECGHTNVKHLSKL